ncbi:hypothetical protein [Morganella morganii]|uniref:hypothetical protein n=1 Tax=Morganella morganii TaxID=582 RepID=UPI00055AD666|nr:hypothetical protein [Morganella morganii]AVK36160.1 hypothetical protein CSB69_1044 [Morganella morganii]ELO7538147.1 hypothetical protein [Morganella morganii]MBN4019362.1 hypothetical protein [Morganella morganii]MBO8065878.1 hypothetical protein [Morganella morganii]QSB62788.1 hypothetical protein JW291_01750 [Morganella morganii]
MNSNEFFNSILNKEIAVEFSQDISISSIGLNNEALFQIPFIAMILLVISTDKRKTDLSEVGHLVGELIEETMIGFKKSSQHLNWSANLRIRTVTALNFLELKETISIKKNKIYATSLGKKIIEKVYNSDTDLAYNLGLIKRAYRNNLVDKKLDGELI